MKHTALPASSPGAPSQVGKLFRRLLRSVIVLYVAIYEVRQLNNVLADLPIHTTTSDVKGLWLFSLSPPTRGVVQSCGSAIPNKNSSNLRSELRDYKSFLETQGGVFKQVRLQLAEKPVPFTTARSQAAAGRSNRHSWKSLGVFDGENPDALVGSWTTVYDEGFEVDLGGNLRMMGFMKYSLDPTCKAVPLDGDLEDRSGNTKCYVTDARRTHLGWYVQQQDGEPVSGCFHAERVDAPSQGASPSAFVVVDEAYTTQDASFLSVTPATPPSSKQQRIQKQQDLSYYVSQEFIDLHNASPASSWKAGLNPVFAQADAATLSKYIKDSGMRKLYRRGSSGFEVLHSFVESESASSSASKDQAEEQLYACPCKKGERRLDTRLSVNQTPVAVLSPLSVLESGVKRSFLASITPHRDKSVSFAEGTAAHNSSTPAEAVPPSDPARSAHLKGSADISTVPLSALETSTENLPANFAWSDPFSGTAFDDEVTNQGSCGSCYAIAATYTLQKRFEIAASKMLGRDVKLFGDSSGNATASGGGSPSLVDLRGETGSKGNLSAQSILSCSFYNQGCDGGYPYLVGKHARDIGIPQETCMSYDANDTTACPFQSGHEHSPVNNPKAARSLLQTESGACVSNARWYASDYGYVGSCYECNQCSGEKLIMDEVFRNGPVVAALEAPSSLFSYEEGIYDVDMSNQRHSRVCDVDNPECNGLTTGWEFTNHAVVITGWGEDIPKNAGDNAQARKFWIVRNTWGPLWGQQGYVKIARGKNLGGIESQATWIDPDFTRGVGRKVAEKIKALKANEVTTSA